MNIEKDEMEEHLKPHKSQGKWVTINPYLNFDGLDNSQYSPEVWIVKDDHDPFDLPPELTQFKPDWDYTMLREDAVEVWKGNHYDSTKVFVFTDDTWDYVIHETSEGHGAVESSAVTRVRHNQ